MTLSPGTRIGPYEVVASIGAGGMGEVYRARDSRLDRDVAVKILPDIFAVDADRLGRFEREARVLASLNHPNIAHLYGLEAAGRSHALVMELVEGPTLADRIAQGPIPLDEALPIARQIADALEFAHEQGIVHRDLKPANIKLRTDGTVKVLDFGLAKAFDPAAASTPEAMQSPTLTARATQLGLIIGTAAYMAPEQARGRAVDRRADIWAFGVVLYEMLTGCRAFDGDDVSITLASVLKEDVPWDKLAADLPAGVRRVLRRCLEKEPRRRLSAIGDARFDLDEGGDIAAPPHATRDTVRTYAGWAVAFVMAVVAAATLFVWAPWREAAAAPPTRLKADIGVEGTLAANVAPALAISPDGRSVVMAVMNNGRSQLYVRHLGEISPVALAGTEDGTGPFFSPDGQWIGFFAGQKLKKVALSGGAAVALTDAPLARGGSWGEDGAIVFQKTAAPSLLSSVSTAGGAATTIGKASGNESVQRWPDVLPGGRGILYSSHTATTGFDRANIMVLPADGGAPKLVLRGGYCARYVKTGHLLYVHEGTLFGVRFDTDRLAVQGTPFPLVEGIFASTVSGGAQFSVSDAGTLVYVMGRTAAPQTPVHLMDVKGNLTVLRQDPAEWAWPRYSPDGSRLALAIGSTPDTDIWIYEPDRDLTKFTFSEGADFAPVWTPDGRRIVFSSERERAGAANLYWRNSDGSGSVERLTQSSAFQIVSSVHPSGRYIAYGERAEVGNFDIKILPMEETDASGWKPGSPTTFLSTPSHELQPVFSPDGNWIAYMSNENGAFEVYVRRFPSGEGPWKVSTGNGVFPTWSPRRPELFYAMSLNVNSAIMRAPYSIAGASFRAGRPEQWSQQSVRPHGTDRVYDVAPDGAHVVFSKPPDFNPQELTKIVFVFNFFDELRRATGK